MSITLNHSDSGQGNIETAVAVKMMQKAKQQQELEGQMALQLIDTAGQAAVPAPTASAGQHINIKV